MNERLNERQVALLRAIGSAGWSCPTQLAVAIAAPKPFVSRTSLRLAAMRLVDRKRDTKDNRKVGLRRLPAGDAFLARLEAVQ